MKILFKLTSRSRPAKLFETIENIISLAHTDNYVIQCTLDVDDKTAITDEFVARIKSYERVKAWWGISFGKVSAINRDMGLINDWDILVNVSDDQKFLVPGFDKIIIADMRAHFPNGCGVLHYPDSHTKRKLMTMSIMDRKYFELDGWIYYPRCKSVYVDNIAMGMAERRKKFVFIDKPIQDHFHPAWGTGKWDEQYGITEHPDMYAHDKAIFDELKAANYNL